MKKNYLIITIIVSILISINSFSQNWIVDTTFYGTYVSFSDVSFATPERGFACGYDKVFYKTTNAGKTWNPITVAQTYNDIEFIDGLTGYRIGENGKIDKTTDGGFIWTPLTSGTTINLTEIFLLSADTVWIVGYNTTNYVVSVFKTVNGGATWTTSGIGSTSTVHDIYFINSSVGFIGGMGGACIWRTTNGGANWNVNCLTGSSISGIDFINDTTGFACGNDGKIYKTINAGLSWFPLTSGTTDHLRSIQFTDDLNGWAVGYNGTILHTSNGGNTWDLQNSSTSSQIMNLHMISNDYGYAVSYIPNWIGGEILRFGNYTMSYHIEGINYFDANNNCIKNNGEVGFPLPLIAMPNNHYAFSNDTGLYSLGINMPINYTLQTIIPQRLSHMIQTPCPASYNVNLNVNSPQDTSGFNFGFDGTPCFQLKVNVSGNRKRRCFRNFTTVNYQNEGLIAANNVTVRVKFAAYDIPVSASLPYTIDVSDSSLVFNIGTLNAWESGVINITDSIACVNGITGLTQCTKAWILPVNQCLIDATTGGAWDHSSIKVEGECKNDTVRFVIYNHGSGDMASSSVYRVYANNALVYTANFQLASGDSLVVLWVSGGATIRLEADQHPQHPGNSHPRETIEGCGTNGLGNISTGQVNLAPMDDEDVDVEIDCIQIRDSYDPNEKNNSPEGIASDHIVLPKTSINFTIHFQNTGSDTAYKVVIIDTLSSHLDLSTLELGAASHPYTTSISGEGSPVLKFTFNNINLTDSTSDELHSHGFVKYRITPKSATPLDTRINNTANIYFDFNLPIRTNTAFVTLGNYPGTVTSLSELNSSSESINVYPNPTLGEFTVTSKFTIYKIEIYNIMGEKVYDQVANTKLQTLNPKLSQGVYFLNCITEIGSKKLRLVKY